MAVDTSELMARICALEIEALAQIGIDCDAAPRWRYQQEALPYWRNRILTVQLDTAPDDYGEEMDVYIYTIGSALVMAHATAGYQGETDEAILAAIPQMIEYLDAREVLQSAAFPSPMHFLRKASFYAGNGYEDFGLSAAGSPLVGPSFQWRCTLEKFIQQAYT